MTTAWPQVKLGEILKPVSRAESVDPAKTYNILGAHWYAKGLYTKDILTGASIQAPRVYRVEKSDFVYNRLFAWKGSFSLATEENDGCYVSNEFPCFSVNSDRLDGRYLWLYFSRNSIWNEALGLSTGGTPTSRNRLKEGQFLGLTISLPPVPEQRRIVARIEELSAKIDEARQLRQQNARQVEGLVIAMARRDDLDEASKRQKGWRIVALGEVIQQKSEIHAVKPEAKYPNVGIYSFGRGLFAKSPINGISTSAPTLNRIRSGQFIYSRLFAFEGAYGMVPEEFDGCFVSNEYPTFECSDRVKAEFLYAYFKSPTVWTEVAAGSKGLGHRRQRVHPERILAYRLMLPPMEWQIKICSVLAGVQSANKITASSEAELNALMPSILSRAFAGYL